ncbi:MAG TPA: MFS transporter [Thermomicrobiales bacterium]|nr:MFS transporter [Thermomicrobiales bacterium]
MTARDAPAAERVGLVTVALGTMLAPLNSTMIVVALPTILREFEYTLAWGAWIVVAYLVTMAAGQPLGGSLGDRYGQRRLFQIGLVGFLAASALATLAPSLAVLIVARTCQAAAGALVVPNGMALVRSLVAAERHGAAFGRIGAGVAIAATIGTPLGGVLTDAFDWRAIFAANLALIGPALVLSVRLPAGRTAAQVGRFDLSGAALLITTLITLAASLTLWRVAQAPVVLAPLLGLTTIVAGLLLWRHVSDHPAPVVRLNLFRQSGYAPASLLALLVNLTMYTVLLSLPVFLTERAGWSSSATGVLLAAMSLQMVVFAPFGGWLADRRGWRYPATLGSVLLAAGALALVSIDTGWGWAVYLGPLVLIGAGVGLSSAPTQALAVDAAPAAAAGQAAGLFSTTTYLGSILGSAGMAAILGDGVPTTASFRLLYVAVSIAAILGVLAAVRLPAGHGRRVDEQPDQAAARDLAPSRR